MYKRQEKGKGPVLAVDADANSNLNEVLGVKVDTTLGDVREEIAQAELAAKSPIPTGMSKADYAELRFEDALIEDDDFDLLVMGRTQGKGCYCYVTVSYTHLWQPALYGILQAFYQPPWQAPGSRKGLQYGWVQQEVTFQVTLYSA